jgi:hypothetical protein
VPCVEAKQFVQQRGAAAPVAEDEQRRLADGGAFGAAAKGNVLQEAQQGVDDA